MAVAVDRCKDGDQKGDGQQADQDTHEVGWKIDPAAFFKPNSRIHI
jgi:hypothetical protein